MPGQVVIRRRPLDYVVSLLIPSVFLMLVDLGSFFLPPTCRARIVFKTSVLVGYTVFRVNVSAKMPRSSVHTPLIGEQPRGTRRPSCIIAVKGLMLHFRSGAGESPQTR